MELARKELGEDALLVNARPATPETRHLGAYEVVFGVPPDDAGAAGRDRSPALRRTVWRRTWPELRREIERMAQSAARRTRMTSQRIEYELGSVQRR